MIEGPDPDPYLWLVDPDPGGSKNMWIRWIRIRNTDRSGSRSPINYGPGSWFYLDFFVAIEKNMLSNRNVGNHKNCKMLNSFLKFLWIFDKYGSTVRIKIRMDSEFKIDGSRSRRQCNCGSVGSGSTTLAGNIKLKANLEFYNKKRFWFTSYFFKNLNLVFCVPTRISLSSKLLIWLDRTLMTELAS